MDVDTSSRSEQRKFGIVMAVAITVVTLLHWLIRGDLTAWPFYLAAAFLILGLIAPPVLKPIFIIWMKFALVLNWIITRVLLSVIFYGMITPMRFAMSLVGNDPLKRELLPDAETYWEAPDEQPEDPARYENMY